jgi:SNF2 family DNA or RNA helicase
MEIELTRINNTPVFSVQGNDSHWTRVYGATFDKHTTRWLFPAFPPFIDNVLQDFSNVHPDVPLSAEAKQWVKELGDLEFWKKMVTGMNLPTKSYEHQLDGLAQVLHNYRWILNWEMGTGKSKVIIDALNYLRTPTLILCPRIAVDNWAKEIELHSGGALTSVVVKGATRNKKLNVLQSYENQDAVITTFDTARIYGTPQLLPKAVKVFGKHSIPPNRTLKQVLRRINDGDVQSKLALDWLQGRKIQDIRTEVEERTQGKRQWLWDLPYRMIVADESHRIKRIQSSTTKICLQLAQKAARRYALSGTLAQGDPRDLFPQLNFLGKYLVPEDWFAFCKKYLVYSKYNDKIVTGYQNLHVLNQRVERVSSIKKLTECVDLPERKFETIYFTLSPAQRKDYNRIVSTNRITRPDGEELELANGAVKIGKLLQLCSGFLYIPEKTEVCDTCSSVMDCVAQNIKPGTSRCTNEKAAGFKPRSAVTYAQNPKLDTVKDLLKDLASSSKVIIWACLEQELDSLEEMLRQEDWGYVRVDGNTTHRIKEMEEVFATDETCRVYLAQISTGIAITLNAATHTIYYSRDWSLENRQQSLFRNFRIGQAKKTVVYDICAKGSLEVQQLNALQRKANVSKLLTDHVDCALCNRYVDCLKDNVSPWTASCVLSTGVEKQIARARTL